MQANSPEETAYQFTLVVGNDGIKLQEAPDFARIKALRFQLVKALVKQIYGKIEFDQSRGTEFKISFSDPDSLEEEEVMG